MTVTWPLFTDERQFLLESKEKQIPRFARDDMLSGVATSRKASQKVSQKSGRIMSRTGSEETFEDGVVSETEVGVWHGNFAPGY